jgi:hypothetical protein
MADEDTPAPSDTDDAPETPDTSNADADKWKALSRKHEKQAKELATRLQELEDRDKSEGEKLAGRIAAAEKRADEAEARAIRLEVATSKGLTAAQAKRLVGATKEELEADADELISTFKPAEPDPVDTDDEPDDDTPSPSNRPTPSLKGGGDPTQAPDPDIRKVVDSIPRSF